MIVQNSSAGQLALKKKPIITSFSDMESTFTIRHSAALVSAIELLITTKTIKPGIGHTLQAIATYWNPAGKIYPSQSTLAAMTGVARRTIITHIQTLTSLGIIKTQERTVKASDGKRYCTSLNYTFNADMIGRLFNKARQVLKKSASKTALTAKNDHTPPIENDHTISSNEQGLKITAKAALLGWFKSVIKKSLQHEADHIVSVAKKGAYNAAVLKNKIAKGHAFSKAELKRRQQQADAVRPEREAAEVRRSRIDELLKQLLQSRFQPDAFDAQKHAELLNLTDNGTRVPLSIKFALEGYAKH
jgi:DNA-binding transcriptional MocR family regulator